MPVMGGQEFYRAIRELDQKMAGRLIFATGDTVSEDVRKFLDGTGNPVVSKPFRLEEMDEVIESLFSGDQRLGNTPPRVP
jgi:CheY-like chemotaxis protein